MKKFLAALITTVLCGGYAALCLGVGLNVLKAVAQSAHTVTLFVYGALFILGNIIGWTILKRLPLIAVGRKIFKSTAWLAVCAALLWLLRSPEAFLPLFSATTMVTALRIFWVQMKKPS